MFLVPVGDAISWDRHRLDFAILSLSDGRCTPLACGRHRACHVQFSASKIREVLVSPDGKQAAVCLYESEEKSTAAGILINLEQCRTSDLALQPHGQLGQHTDMTLAHVFWRWSLCSRRLVSGTVDQGIDSSSHHVLLSLIDTSCSNCETGQMQYPLQLFLLQYNTHSIASFTSAEGPWSIHWAPDSDSLAVTGAWECISDEGPDLHSVSVCFYRCCINFAVQQSSSNANIGL